MKINVNDIQPVQIGKHLVGPGQSVIMVAEIGINANGDLDLACRIIDVAVKSGAQFVKFQTRMDALKQFPASELSKPRPIPRPLLEKAIRRGVLPESAIKRLRDSNFENSLTEDIKRLLEWTDDEYEAIDNYCRSVGIGWFTACWDAGSIDRMEKFNLPAWKIASPCNQDEDLLRRARATGKPVILSTGMSDLDDVRWAMNVLGPGPTIILHCTSVYPKGTETGDEIRRLINLRGMDTLREEFGVPIGFSSHDNGIKPTYAAAARGACMIEKHLTLQKTMYGSDQSSSLDPLEWEELCRGIRELDQVLGNGKIEKYPDEIAVEKKLRRVWRNK